MSALETAAEFIADQRLMDQAAARSERVKLHVLDTHGALIAGSGLEEGAAARSIDSSMALASACAAARCTEIDDIHLSSCTTPGSVIVPTALYLASKGELGSWDEFSAAVLAGYELLIRLGFAADGPMVLGRIWPTYFAASFGSAAVASRAFRLSAPQTAGALATALAFCSGTSPTPATSQGSSRWLSLGVAATNGVLAARCACRGLLGSAQLLDRSSGRIAGVEISESRLLGGLGERFLFDDTGMKPYPVARQALAAIEAARELVDTEKIEPGAITEIVVGVPAAQLRVIDHPEMPGTRMGSIVSVQYQIALALDRTPPATDDRIREMMTKVRVQRAPELEEHYPDAWPGKVEIRVENGTVSQRFSRTVIHPPGDARNPFDGDAVAKKFRRLAAPHVGMKAAENLIYQVREEISPTLWSAALPYVDNSSTHQQLLHVPRV